MEFGNINFNLNVESYSETNNAFCQESCWFWITRDRLSEVLLTDCSAPGLHDVEISIRASILNWKCYIRRTLIKANESSVVTDETIIGKNDLILEYQNVLIDFMWKYANVRFWKWSRYVFQGFLSEFRKVHKVSSLTRCRDALSATFPLFTPGAKLPAGILAVRISTNLRDPRALSSRFNVLDHLSWENAS